MVLPLDKSAAYQGFKQRNLVPEFWAMFLQKQEK